MTTVDITPRFLRRVLCLAVAIFEQFFVFTRQAFGIY